MKGFQQLGLPILLDEQAEINGGVTLIVAGIGGILPGKLGAWLYCTLFSLS